MTAVTIWHDRTVNLLWAVADTRISQGPGAAVIMTDAGAKLHVLSVVCRPLRQMTAIRNEPHQVLKFGFAYSGSTLPALETFATASSCLEQLEANTTDPPSLRDVGELVRRLGTRFGNEVAESRNQSMIGFNAAVFGWCGVLRKYAVYTLTPDCRNDRLELSMQEVFPAEHPAPIILGSGRERVLAEIQRLTEGARGGDASGRIPMRAMDNIVRSAERTDDVGGGLSIGVALQSGFELFGHASPLVHGQPRAKMTYNGIDVDELGQVGAYRIAWRLMPT